MSDEKATNSNFAVALIPEFENGKWTGIVSAHIEEDLHNDLSVDELTQIRSVCGMMAASLTLMENDPEFLDYVRSYFIDNFQALVDDILSDAEDKPSFTRSEDGKVITLSFDSKTYGNA